MADDRRIEKPFNHYRPILDNNSIDRHTAWDDDVDWIFLDRF